MPEIYDELAGLYANQGTAAAIDRLIEELRASGRYHELFEALKMRVRRELGLPMLFGDSGDALPPQTRQKLEDGLIDACRDVGTLLLNQGKLREGWMYLRPVGDRAEAARLIAGIPASDENAEELIEVLLREGIDPARGFELLLNSYGTCNAITTFDTEMPRHDKTAQRAAAALLVRRVHDDLVANVRMDIGRTQSAEAPAGATLAELVADRDWLFADNSYHIDTTHLAATVRAARLAIDPEVLRLALDLTEYGRRLSKQFQYQGDEPFADQYPAAAHWLSAQLGQNVDVALAYFREKAKAIDAARDGTMAAEFYVELLVRLGRHDEAIAASIELLPGHLPRAGICPALLELAELSGNYDAVLQHTRAQDDLLAYTAALVKAKRNAE